MNWYHKRFDELTNHELYEILRLRINIFVIEQNCPYDECDGKDYAAIHFFAKNNKDIMAYARILPPGISFKEVSIGRVAVSSNYRGNGFARKIMKEIIDYIHEYYTGTSIKIEAQEYLRTFYVELGFIAISEVFLLDNIPHIEMLYKV